MSEAGTNVAEQEEAEMDERLVEVTSKNGGIPTFFVAPGGGSEHPAIILYMDAPGIREELFNIARRIAKQGYACVVPDLYHRYGRIRFDLPRRNDGMSQVIRAAYLALTDADIDNDTAAMLGFLEAQPEVRSGKVGGIGFCMSGRFVTTAAISYPRHLVCGASLYGTRLVVDEESSPHTRLAGLRAEMYYGFGDLDATTPPGYIETFRSALDAAGARYTMDVFEGVDHGYAFPERAMYHAVSAETSWEKIFDLFERNLR